ncbi:MAG: response regulator transcription factor [Gemmatimonadetes bacterium]|nr:response regulator transcription factor [Gemmatimonadota bacterium]
MSAIRALIVDDEPLARRGMRQLLSPYRDIVVVGECRDGREALRCITTLSPDLVFLDVQMPGFDGFAVIRAYGADRMPAVVFVTAYDEFAVRAFETHALDYLVKPVSETRFAAAVTRVRERMRLKDVEALAARLAALLEGVPEHVSGPDGDEPKAAAVMGRITVPTTTGKLMLEPGEIVWIEAEDYYAAIHTYDRRHRVRESLAAFETRLNPAHFVRVHRGAIVNLDQVRELREEPGSPILILRDGTRVPVSRRRQARLKSLLRH